MQSWKKIFFLVVAVFVIAFDIPVVMSAQVPHYDLL